MKKIFAFMLALVLLAALTACRQKRKRQKPAAG
jgi:predicted small lipoprotein YifL